MANGEYKASSMEVKVVIIKKLDCGKKIVMCLMVCVMYKNKDLITEHCMASAPVQSVIISKKKGENSLKLSIVHKKMLPIYALLTVCGKITFKQFMIQTSFWNVTCL